MRDVFIIDGSQGEGGGQILRTALALSLVTGQPCRIERIRAGRQKPGLLRQHLTAVQAAVQVSGGRAEGAELGSSTVTFAPGRVPGGDHHFAVGTAGSATLVLQAVLPALMLAPQASRVTLEGGTHNPLAPPFDFLQRSLLPLLARMGVGATATLDRHGFYPAGGGRFTVEIEPATRLRPLALRTRGPVTKSARALVSGLPEGIGTRELKTVHEKLGVPWASMRAETLTTSPGPGNVLLIDLASEDVTEVVTGFGEKNVPAGVVADRACTEARAYLAAGVPVGRHLADQLLLPLALAAGGEFRTLPPTRHTTTNVDVIRRFLEVPIDLVTAEGVCTITINNHGAAAPHEQTS